MKSICLISLPSPFLLDERVFPPLGILYVASALRCQGYEEVHVHDGLVIDIPYGYDVYAIGATTPQFPYAVEALQHIRNANKSKVYIGGAHATVDPDSCLQAGFDGVIMGDGEIGLKVAVDYNCRLIDAPVDKEYHPDRKSIDLPGYKYYIGNELATSVMTSRGCPYHCGFCCKTRKGVKIFPAEFVIEELKHLRNDYGYKSFMFFDDIFILDKKRLLIILNEIKNWGVTWRCFARADILVKHGKDIVQKMKDAGCVEIGMGIESGSDAILKVINKGETTDTIKRALKILKEVGIRVKGFFIVGLPSESWETIQDTMKFIEESPPDDLDFTILQPYKKSSIYENKKNYDIQWDEIDLRHSWYKGNPESYYSNVWTSKMTRDDIVLARKTLEEKYKRW